MSATVVARRVAATPARPAADAWNLIVDLIAAAGTMARQELDRAAGIAMSLIASEATRDRAIVVQGVGPLLRVYCLYDDDAVLGEAASEDALSWCPTDGEWAMSLPCPPEDLSWVQPALARVCTRISARSMEESSLVPQDREEPKEVNVGPVDVEAFFKP